jgi:hypothetical protein
MEFNDNDDVIQEMPEYSPKSEFSKAEVVEQAIIKCADSRAQEMKAGYFNTIIDKNGLINKQWIPDSRDKFISSVKALMSLLHPEIIRDKEYQNKSDEIETEENMLRDTYSYEERKIETDDKGRAIYKKTGKKYIPIIDEVVVIEKVDQRTGKVVGEPMRGGWNEVINQYKDELVLIYDKYFAELNQLIDRLNYFKVQAGF